MSALDEYGRCEGTKANGERCGFSAGVPPEHRYCGHHDPRAIAFREMAVLVSEYKAGCDEFWAAILSNGVLR